MSRALDGIVILDLTQSFWASLGVALLADFGADVLRDEDAAALGDGRAATMVCADTGRGARTRGPQQEEPRRRR
jgi:crotonobetainyl-CoA:carnitine CoA-transferase CaiB-like acyl-CoA transferase